MSQRKVNENHIAYKKVHDFFNLGNPIVSLIHTKKRFYALTKKRELFSYRRSAFVKHQPGQDGPIEGELKCSEVVPENIQKIGVINANGKSHILVLAKNKMYIWTENVRSPFKFRPADFDNADGSSSPLIYNFTTISDNGLLVALVPKYLIIYQFTGIKFIANCFIQFNKFDRKKTIELVGALTHFIIHTKTDYMIYDMDLMPIQDVQPFPKNFKALYPIERTNGFIFLTQENHLININERVLDNKRMMFSDDILCFNIKLPYVYGITSKKILVQTTAGNIQESLPIKGKSFVMDILDDYNIVIGNGSALQLIRFVMVRKSPHIPHAIKMISQNTDPSDPEYFNNWDNIMKLCQRFDSKAFDTTKILQEIYFEYSESLIAAQKFQRAFEMFHKSGKHPFYIIHNFRLLLHPSESDLQIDFLSIANEDCNKHINLLKEVQRTANIAFEKKKNGEKYDKEVEDVINARMNVINQAELNVNPPTKQLVKDKLEEIIKRTENQLAAAYETSSNLSKILFSLENAKVIWKEEGIYDLQKYIETVAKNERQPTTLKVYNTILAECYGTIVPGKLKKFIDNRNPLFFEIAASALKYAAPEDFRNLCRIHNKDEMALEPLLSADPIVWDTVIDYIKESNNFIELGRKYFKEIFSKSRPRAKPRCVEMFFSRSLGDPSIEKPKKASMIEEVLKIIHDEFPPEGTPEEINDKVTKIQIKFLKFAIFQCKVMIGSVHWSIIKLYLSLIGPIQKKMDEERHDHYVKIASEKEPLRTYRSELIDILNFSDSYKTQETLDALMNVSENLIEERLTVLKKANPPRTQEAIDLVSSPNFPIDVALDFCNSVYPEIDSNIYNKLLQAYQLLKQNSKGDKNADELIKKLLNECADKMQLQGIVNQVPPNFKINEMNGFLKASTSKSINKLRTLKLKNILLEKTIQTKREQLQKLKEGKVIVTDGLKCVICGKKIAESVFVALGDNTVAHLACRMST